MFSYIQNQTTIVSNETVSIKCSSSSLQSGLDMVDFATHFTILDTKVGFKKKSTFYLESVVLESRSSTNSLPK